MNNNYLYHHGILGQEWGKRNGPPYPLGAEDHSRKEKKAGYQKSINKSKEGYQKSINRESGSSSKASNEKEIENWINKSHKGLDQNTKAKLIKAAKYVGIIAGTAAASVAVGYLLSNKDILNSYAKAASKNMTGHVDEGIFNINDTGANYTYSINELLKFDRGPGSTAKKEGLNVIRDTETFKELLELDEPATDIFQYATPDQWIKYPRLALLSGMGDRRLSCWSGSNAYYLTSLTGVPFGSKNFQNLVNFNDFSSLYNHEIKKFKINGELASDFVGKFGRGGQKADANSSALLAKSILQNVSKDANLTTDGKRTIGFINAAYRGMTCTHQWNFEIQWGEGGAKELFMADSYTGERYSVMKQLANGTFSESDQLPKLTSELFHYNMDSLRFYAPSLSDINADSMAKVVLTAAEALQHMEMGNDYLQHYGVQGMRWGIRRYQNEDGSYTNAGKRRYGMNLDLNDKSRKNVAKIRLGEARRRLDVAKSNNSTNTTRQADLQARVRSAKRAVRNANKIDRGAKLAAKGKTITSENFKSLIGYGAGYLSKIGWQKFLDMRVSQLISEGRYHETTRNAANFLRVSGVLAISLAENAYALKKQMNANDLRAYNVARSQGETSLKRTGSEEYASVIERSKKK